jgi:hypothetical protein
MRWGIKVAAALVLALCLAPVGAVADPAYDPAPPPDTTPPETKIERSLFRISTRTAKFWFSASEAAQGFLCRLDKGDFRPCGSPRAYKHLKPGRHAFRVKAVDAAGNVDESAAVAKFKIPKPHHGRR